MRSPISLVRSCSLLLAAFVALAPAAASAHARLLDPAPRNPLDDNKDQGAPCGVPGEARTVNPTVYRPGQTITVRWEETIDHAGHYEIAISMNGEENFVDIDRDIADSGGATPRTYEQQITLPNEECESCTLRMMQFMENSGAPYYKSCADIVISAAAADDGGTGDGGAGGDGGPPPSGGIGEPPGLCAVSPGGGARTGWSAVWLAALVGALALSRRRR